MKKSKSKRGGYRPGSGRKKVADELVKKQVTVYLVAGDIEKVGGVEAAKEIMVGAVVDMAYKVEIMEG